jgi:hypothetical protein
MQPPLRQSIGSSSFGRSLVVHRLDSGGPPAALGNVPVERVEERRPRRGRAAWKWRTGVAARLAVFC